MILAANFARLKIARARFYLLTTPPQPQALEGVWSGGGGLKAVSGLEKIGMKYRQTIDTYGRNRAAVGGGSGSGLVLG